MKVEQVTFHNGSIEVAVIDGKPFVALKPICESLDLDWPTQRVIIKRDPVLSSVVGEFPTTATDGKQYDMLCLPLDYLNGWLFRINANRYRGARRDLIIQYQRECYQVLARHFMSSSQSPAAPAETDPAELEGKVAKVAACIQTEVARVALAETGLLRYELYCFALKHGITDPEELVELARAAMTSPDRHDYCVVPPMPPTRWQFGKVHPATFNRAMNRYLNRLSLS